MKTAKEIVIEHGPVTEIEREKKQLLDMYNVIEEKTNHQGVVVSIDINCQRMAQMIINGLNYHFVTLDENKMPLLYFDGKCYRNNGKIKVGEILEEFIPKYYNTYILKEVTSYIQHSNVKKRTDFKPPLNLINLENGIFDMKTGKLLKHSYKYLFNFVLPIIYDKKAIAHKYEKFLKEITSKDGEPRTEVYNTLQEFLGFCFYREYIYKKFLIMDGENDNGKTTLMNIWTKVLGGENIASVPLQELNDKAFRKNKLYGKHGNFSDELPNKTMKFSNIIKEVTGNSPIWADIKNNLDGINFYNYAKCFFTCNEIPETSDIGDAFFTRQLQVTLHNKYVQKGDPKIDNKTYFERNTNEEQMITTKKEISGIFNHAMQGLKRLHKNKGFTDETTIEEKRTTWLRKSDPILSYFDTQIEETTMDWCIKCQDFLKAVNEYCDENAIASNKTLNMVTRKLSGLDIIKVRKTIDKQRVWVFLGIMHTTDIGMNFYIGKKQEIDQKGLFLP